MHIVGSVTVVFPVTSPEAGFGWAFTREGVEAARSMVGGYNSYTALSFTRLLNSLIMRNGERELAFTELYRSLSVELT